MSTRRSFLDAIRRGATLDEAVNEPMEAAGSRKMRKDGFRTCIADAAAEGGSARDVLAKAVGKRLSFQGGLTGDDGPFTNITSPHPNEPFSAVENPPSVIKPLVQDDWSPEARAAALKARQASAKAHADTKSAEQDPYHSPTQAKAHHSHQEAMQAHKMASPDVAKLHADASELHREASKTMNGRKSRALSSRAMEVSTKALSAANNS